MPRTPTTPIRTRRPERRVLRPAVMASLLLHAAALGGMLWLQARAPVDGPGVRPYGPLRIARQSAQEEDPAPEQELVARLAPLPDLTPPDVLDPVLPPTPRDELDVVFEAESPSVQVQPPLFEEVPLRLAVRVRPRPAPPAPPAPAQVRIAQRSPPPPPATPQVRRAPPPLPRASAPVAPAPLRLVFAPDPRGFYPRTAARRGVEGTATVLLLIDARGRVAQAQVERTSGHDVLDQAALQLARAYRFTQGAGWRRTRLPVTFQMSAAGF